MNKLLFNIIILLSIISLFIIDCNAKPINFKKVPKPNKRVDNDLNLEDFPLLNFQQKVDHFDLLNTDTFKQRYVINDKYWDGKGPIFFSLSGEDMMESDIVTDYQYVIWAKQVNAMIVALEHRYYGESTLSTDTTTENLRFLNTEQALADNAVFIEWIIETKKVPSTSKIVAFGGSYSGILAAALTIKYPNIIDFAISSSAPVDPVLNFYQYIEVTQTTILSVPNGEECLQNIITASEKLVEMVQDPTLSSQVVSTFNLCEPLNDANDISTFMFRVAGNFMSTGQYNDESPYMPTIEEMCQTMVNQSSSNAFENYLQIWRNNPSPNGDCYDVSYQSLVAEYTNTSINPENVYSSVRLWQFQCCTEFGFFLTSDAPSNKQPFGNLFGYNYQTQLCQEAFGIPNMMPSVNWTLTQYGGQHPTLESVENVLFVTGTNDPWSSIGISPTTVPNINYNTVVVENGAHCADMLPVNSISVPDLPIAQAKIFQFIQSNLNK